MVIYYDIPDLIDSSNECNKFTKFIQEPDKVKVYDDYHKYGMDQNELRKQQVKLQNKNAFNHLLASAYVFHINLNSIDKLIQLFLEFKSILQVR